MLGLRAWSDDLAVVLFEFLEDDTKLAQSCTGDVNSNKRGCGTPAQAQSSARVDVPTARVFPAWTKESNARASVRVNAWICACQATDRDLEFLRECLDVCTAVNRP